MGSRPGTRTAIPLGIPLGGYPPSVKSVRQRGIEPVIHRSPDPRQRSVCALSSLTPRSRGDSAQTDLTLTITLTLMLTLAPTPSPVTGSCTHTDTLPHTVTVIITVRLHTVPGTAAVYGPPTVIRCICAGSSRLRLYAFGHTLRVHPLRSCLRTSHPRVTPVNRTDRSTFPVSFKECASPLAPCGATVGIQPSGPAACVL